MSRHQYHQIMGMLWLVVSLLATGPLFFVAIGMGLFWFLRKP